MNKPVKTEKYILHLHKAKKAGRHYDLRLFKGSECHSFALPKTQLPTMSKIVLAIKTHVDSGANVSRTYKYEIPDGEYGAGTLEIVEEGPVHILEWPSDSSKIIMYFPNSNGGQYLKGKYYLVRTRNNEYVFGMSKDQSF